MRNFLKLNPPGEVSTRSSSPPSITDSSNLVAYPSELNSAPNTVQMNATDCKTDRESDEVTPEDELLLEGIIGGPAGVSDIPTDINMTGTDCSATAASGVVG